MPCQQFHMTLSLFQVCLYRSHADLPLNVFTRSLLVND